MQKINILSIVGWHLNSLRDSAGRVMVVDLLVFYGLPSAAGLVFYVFGLSIAKEALELSVTVFSIFAALLLSVQVALYNVSLRPITKPDDPKRVRNFERQKTARNTLIKELNDNISYLILLSVFFITILLGLFVLGWSGPGPSSVAFGIYIHFFLTLLMVVKRASIVFSREYETAE